MMEPAEKTCKCIGSIKLKASTPFNDGPDMEFHKGREYQVDIFPLYYQLYQNGGWEDYIFLTEEEFNRNFTLIE